MGTVTHVETDEPVAALTFDDGPHPEFTPRLLDIFSRYDSHGTFFVLGKNAKSFPELVKRMAEEGHAIGNHSWDHPSFPLISGGERRTQMHKCSNEIGQYSQKLFRPPYGHQSVMSRIDAFMLGYKVVTWNIVAHDWLDHSADWMAKYIIERIKPGSVIVFHDALHDVLEDGYADRSEMLHAVELILETLRNRFRFVTIPELFRYGRPQYSNWYDKADIDFLNRLRTNEGVARHYA